MMPLSMLTYRPEHADTVILSLELFRMYDTRRFQRLVICLSPVNAEMLCHKTKPVRGVFPIQQRSLLLNYYSTMLHWGK